MSLSDVDCHELANGSTSSFCCCTYCSISTTLLRLRFSSSSCKLFSNAAKSFRTREAILSSLLSMANICRSWAALRAPTSVSLSTNSWWGGVSQTHLKLLNLKKKKTFFLLICDFDSHICWTFISKIWRRRGCSPFCILQG